MSATDLGVLAAAAAAIVWVNWYFLLAGRRGGQVASAAGGVQEVTVRVAGGYDPSSIRVRSGTPVRLTFDRQETSGCSEEVVLPDFGVRRYLPAHTRTSVEVTPERPGTYEFTCGMGMLRGRLIAEEEG